MEALNQVMTRILNTSACDDKEEGYECPDCNTFILAVSVEVPELKIKRKVFPTCECVVAREEARIREAQNFAKSVRLTSCLVSVISVNDLRNQHLKL